MPVTTTLRALDYPYDGWASGWGGVNCIRPGGMGIAYELKTTGATGNAVVLNSGVMCHFQTGDWSSNLYNSSVYLPASDIAIGVRFWNWNSGAQTVDIELLLGFLVGLPPIGWIYMTTITIPPPRVPFSIGVPPPPPWPYPATIPNPITMRPLNNSALRVW